MKKIKQTFGKIFHSKSSKEHTTPTQKEFENIVKHSIKKYGKTYRLLEAYDRGDKKATEIVARSTILQDTLRHIQSIQKIQNS